MYWERDAVVKQELTTVSAGLKRLTPQRTADNNLVDGVRTAFAIHKTASQQSSSAHTKYYEKLLADKVVFESKVCRLLDDIEFNVYRILVSPDGEAKPSMARDSERARLLVSKKSMKHQLQLSSADWKDVDVLKHRLDSPVAKKRRSQNIIETLQEQLVSKLFDVIKYIQRFRFYNKLFTTDVTDRFCDFLYSVSTVVKMLVVNQRTIIKATVKTDLEDIDAFLQSKNNKRSRPGRSA